MRSRRADPGRKPGAPGALGFPPAPIRLVPPWLVVPVVLLAGSTALTAQAVPRADLPAAGALRITFDPLIAFWTEAYLGSERRPLGAFLSGDPVQQRQVWELFRLDQDVAVASGAEGFVSNLGAALLALRAERRVTPLQLEMGLSRRLSLGVRVPLVRVQMRAGLALDSTNSNVGRNPRSNIPGADSLYGVFFTGFDAALATMDQNIAAGTYGAPGSPQRAAAQAFADSARNVRAALRRAAYGAGPGDAAPLLPTAASTGGIAISTNLDRIQQELAATWGVAGFTADFLLPTARASATDVQTLLVDSESGWGAAPFTDTRSRLRFWLGDVEVEARWNVANSRRYAATVGALVRLPTGHLDSPHDLIDLSAGDGQTDVEGQLTQELRAGRLWLNAAVRIGVQLPGQRERRLGPAGTVLVPRGATALLDWDPGDYWQVDVAPLYRLNPHFAAGLTLGFSTEGRSDYTFRTAADSIAVETAMGGPIPAAILNGASGWSRLRLGGAVTYTGPVVEGSFVVERVVSGESLGNSIPGSGEPTPAATSFRLVLRTSRRLF